MNTTITRRFEWDMGHRVPEHNSLCRNLHGHRYVAEVTIKGPVIDEAGNPENGMVRDFSVIKDRMSWIINKWDHGFMVDRQDPWMKWLEAMDTKLVKVDKPPTAETIAETIYSALQLAAHANDMLDIMEITVWETPNCKATFKP